MPKSSRPLHYIRWDKNQRAKVIEQAAVLIIEHSLSELNAIREGQKVLGPKSQRNVSNISGIAWDWYREGVKEAVAKLLGLKAGVPPMAPVSTKRGRPRKNPSFPPVPKITLPRAPVKPLALSFTAVCSEDFTGSPITVAMNTVLEPEPDLTAPKPKLTVSAQAPIAVPNDFMDVVGALVEALQEQVVQGANDRTELFKFMEQDRSELTAILQKGLPKTDNQESQKDREEMAQGRIELVAALGDFKRLSGQLSQVDQRVSAIDRRIDKFDTTMTRVIDGISQMMRRMESISVIPTVQGDVAPVSTTKPVVLRKPNVLVIGLESGHGENHIKNSCKDHCGRLEFKMAMGITIPDHRPYDIIMVTKKAPQLWVATAKTALPKDKYRDAPGNADNVARLILALPEVRVEEAAP